jgi:hypothetical protein
MTEPERAGITPEEFVRAMRDMKPDLMVSSPSGASVILSAQDSEAIGRAFRELDTQIGELLHLLGGPYDGDAVSSEEIAITAAHRRAEDALCDIAPLRDRLGWA